MTELNNKWNIYFHDPNDHNWDVSSFQYLSSLHTVEEFVEVFSTFKELFYNGMFFIMRDGITPRWEDDENINGGCFSYKISKFLLQNKLFETCASILGETLGKEMKYSLNINGISVCPKKSYYIIRIWIKNKSFALFEYYNISVPKFSTLMYKNHSEK